MLVTLGFLKHFSHVYSLSQIYEIQISLDCSNLKALYNDRYYNDIHQGFFFTYFPCLMEYFIDIFSDLGIMLAVFEQPDLDHSKTRAESIMGFFFLI